MSLPLYLHEQVDALLGRLLRRAGIDVLTTAEAGRAARGISDHDQLCFAASENRALFTHDYDFFGLALEWDARGLRHAGVIFSQPRPASSLFQGLLRIFESYPQGIQGLCLWLPRE